jgi:hypothetical protein
MCYFQKFLVCSLALIFMYMIIILFTSFSSSSFPSSSSILFAVKAVAYPGDPDVVVSLFRKQGWKQYRAELLDEIPKGRWPMEGGIQREPFRIS